MNSGGPTSGLGRREGKGGSPVSSSNAITPSAHTSAAMSAVMLVDLLSRASMISGGAYARLYDSDALAPAPHLHCLDIP